MNKETIEKIKETLSNFEYFVDDDFGGHYENIDFSQKALTPISILSIIEYIEDLQHRLEEKDKVINKVLERLKLLGKYDGETCTRNFKMMSADFNQLIEWLERGKNGK